MAWRIPWIITKSGYFGYMIRSAFLRLWIRNEHCPAGSGDSKHFQYIHQLFDYTAHLYGHFIPEAWIKRSAWSVLSRW